MAASGAEQAKGQGTQGGERGGRVARVARWWVGQVGVVSALLTLGSLLAVGVALGLRMGSESQSLLVTDPALRLVAQPEVLAPQTARGVLSVPVAELAVPPGSLDRVGVVELCFPALPGGDVTTLAQALQGLEAGWVRTLGGPREVLARHPLPPLAQGEGVERDGRRCLRLPPLRAAGGAGGTHQALFIVSDGARTDWLRSGALAVVSSAAPVLARWEIWCSLLMGLAVLLRARTWARVASVGGLTRLRLFDVFACLMAAWMAWALGAAFVGKEPDVGLRTLVAAGLALTPMMVFPRIIAGRRHPDARAALRLVAPRQGPKTLWLSALTGLALGGLAIATLTQTPPHGASHAQDMALLPGGALAMGTLWLLGAWFEEYFYRGFIFGALLDRFGAAAAVGGAALLQALLWTPQRLGFWWPVGLGLAAAVAAGLLRWKTDSTASALSLTLGYRATIVAAVYMGWLSSGVL